MSDRHYLRMGKYTTIVGVIISIGTAFIVQSFPNLMDYMQLIFSFFNAPLFATFLLGMFWKKATPKGGFWGLLAGISAAMSHYLLYKFHVISYTSEMGANFYQAWWAWLTDFVVTIGVSLVTKKKDEKELAGLVYGLSPRAVDRKRFYLRPELWGSVVLLAALILNILFW